MAETLTTRVREALTDERGRCVDCMTDDTRHDKPCLAFEFMVRVQPLLAAHEQQHAEALKEAYDTALALLSDEPMPNGQYPHLLVCSGDRSKRAGDRRGTCCCCRPIEQRERAAKDRQYADLAEHYAALREELAAKDAEIARLRETNDDLKLVVIDRGDDIDELRAALSAEVRAASKADVQSTGTAAGVCPPLLPQPAHGRDA